MPKNAIVGQSGGPTSVINSSLAGVLQACQMRGADHVYGMLNGIEGLLDERIMDLSGKLGSALEIELLKRTPSSFLGSCRYKLPDFYQNPEVYERLFQKLRKTFHSVAADSRPETMSILFQIYAQILRDSHPTYVNSTSRATVERMASYVHNHIYDPNLSVDKLVCLSELSETHFRRLFQQVYGMTPSKYIMHARIKQAKSLMDMQELTLQDISAQCGFSSYTYFCTAFKAATGLNPSIYRQNFYPAACRKQEPV